MSRSITQSVFQQFLRANSSASWAFFFWTVTIEIGTEHYWGYTKAGENASFEYEVTHPRWDCYKVSEHKIDVNFKSVYGIEFDQFNNLEPISVILAEGSEITVQNKRTIK